MPRSVESRADFAERVRQISADSALPGEAARQVCALVTDEVEYFPGIHRRPHARRGVVAAAGRLCQGMVHLVIGGLRSVGIPARHVSGHFQSRADPQVGQSVSGESHAWVELWDEGWHLFDRTNEAQRSRSRPQPQSR